MPRRFRKRGRPQASKQNHDVVLRENARHGSVREPVASTVKTGDSTAPLQSSRQRRAERGPKQRHTAITSTVRDAWATPVVVSTAKRAYKVKVLADGTRVKVYRNSGYRDPLVTTCDPQAGQQYVYGTG
jgi:hypothetical protein